MTCDQLEIRDDYLAFGKPSFTQNEIDAVARVLNTGWVGMGPETRAFEQELARYIGAENVITVNSCTSGLFLALRASGISAGDEVICPSMTWCATANAAMYLGAKPVFCDVETDTLCASAGTIASKVTDKTKAVVVVHYGGLAVDVDEISRCLPKGVVLVEDAAHALGANYPDGSAVGSKSNLTCFSFYANKNLSIGDGGAVTGSDAAICERIGSLRHLGLDSDAWSRFQRPTANVRVGPKELGFKMNLTDLQSAVGRVQLARQPEMQSVRRRIADRYAQRLANIEPEIVLQANITADGHARHLFPIQLPIEALSIDRDSVLAELRARNIGAAIHYPPLHQLPLYADDSRLPNIEAIAERNITLPISSSMSIDDADYVIEHFIDVIEKYHKAD